MWSMFNWFRQQPPAVPSSSAPAATPGYVKRLEMENQKLKRTAAMGESYGWGDFYQPDAYASELLLDPNAGYSGLATPNWSGIKGRSYGYNYPFVRNDQDLINLRNASRLCVATNPYAEGTLNGLTSYVISTGYSATCKSDTEEDLAAQCQEIIAEWMDRNNFDARLEELYRRAETDGEAIIRMFPQNDSDIAMRFIEPECIVRPYEGDEEEWSLGIKTDPEDTENKKWYNVRFMNKDGSLTDEKVKAKWIVHYKLNSTASQKRGIPSFSYATLESFNQALKLKTALGVGAAVQASIAGIREHNSATEQQLEDFADNTLTNIPGMPFVFPSTQPTNYQGTGVIQPGTIIDLTKNSEWKDPPGANAVEEHTTVLQALLRAAGSRWSCPEWLVSGKSDSSSYASSLTAESPFLRSCARRQRDLKRVIRDILEVVLTNAALNGKIPMEWDETVSIDISSPAMEVRDIGALARANEIYHKMRVKSLRTISADIGLNYTKERAYLAQEAKDELQPTDPVHNLNPETAVAAGYGPTGGAPKGIDNNPSARVVDSEVAGVDPKAQSPNADAKAQSSKPPVPTKDDGKDSKKK